MTVAEKYLRNLDLRKRQVAVKVQILNVDLSNDKTIDSSFSARMGNTFIVSKSGNAFINFGDYKPGNEAGTGRLGNNTAFATPGAYSAGVPMQAAQDVVGAAVESQEVYKPPYVEAQELLEVDVFDKDGNKTGTEFKLFPKLAAPRHELHLGSTSDNSEVTAATDARAASSPNA